MARHHKVKTELSPDELAALEDFVREVNYTRTVEQCLEWVQAKGHTISKTAVWNWLQEFIMTDRSSRARELARDLMVNTSSGDQAAMADLSSRKFQELLFDALMRSDELDAGELLKLSIAHKNSVSSIGAINELRAKQADAVKVAEAQAKAGKSAGDVVATIKQALGIAA